MYWESVAIYFQKNTIYASSEFIIFHIINTLYLVINIVYIVFDTFHCCKISSEMFKRNSIVPITRTTKYYEFLFAYFLLFNNETDKFEYCFRDCFISRNFYIHNTYWFWVEINPKKLCFFNFVMWVGRSPPITTW